MQTPRIFISHQTACQYWLHRELWETKKTRSVPVSADKQNAVSLEDARRFIIGLDESEEIHVSVSTHNETHALPGVAFHCRSAAYPDWSFRQISKDVFVASPELCFLQAASVLPFKALVLYGMELCGTYARVGGAQGVRYKREPLTSARKIRAYLEKSAGAHGVKAALRASACLLDGSASPRESALVALMTLPPKEQGFSLPKPSLNYGIPVEAASKLTGEQLVLHGDVVWPDAKLIVEYDGSQHGIESNHESDKQRDHLLLDAGYEVVRFTDASIRSGVELERLARTVNRKAHLRRTKAQLAWDFNRENALQELLFGSTPTWVPSVQSSASESALP